MSSHPVRISRSLPAEQSTLDGLRRETLLVALVGLGGLVCCGSLLDTSWLLGALSVWVFAIGVLFRSLDDNRISSDGALASNLGWASLVTLQRGWLLSSTAGFLFLPAAPSTAWLAWAPAIAYSTAALLDHVDGRLARRLGSVTRLGARLDMELDAAGILIASALAIHYGKLPVLYIAIGLARYAFVLGIAWRKNKHLPVRELHPSRARRWLAGFQMGFLAAALWPLVPSAASHLAAAVFGSTTLLMFGRDWLVVSGRMDPEGPHYRSGVDHVERVREWLTWGARVAAAAGTVIVVASSTGIALPAKGLGVLGAALVGSGFLRLTGAFSIMVLATLAIREELTVVLSMTLLASLLILLFDLPEER